LGVDPEVLFQGYMIFTRFNPYWSSVSTSWGFTIGPYLLIVFFSLLVYSWLIRTRWRQGLWTWQVTPIKRIDLARGVAPKTIPQEYNNLTWRGVFRRFLEAL
jgi:hypothetical protein